MTPCTRKKRVTVKSSSRLSFLKSMLWMRCCTTKYKTCTHRHTHLDQLRPSIRKLTFAALRRKAGSEEAAMPSRAKNCWARLVGRKMRISSAGNTLFSLDPSMVSFFSSKTGQVQTRAAISNARVLGCRKRKILSSREKGSGQPRIAAAQAE